MIYRAVIEGCNFNIVEDGKKIKIGYFTTLDINAVSMKNMYSKLEDELSDRMLKNNVLLSSSAFSRSHFIIKQLFEVENEEKELGGFTFFKQSLTDSTLCNIRYWARMLIKSKNLIVFS